MLHLLPTQDDIDAWREVTRSPTATRGEVLDACVSLMTFGGPLNFAYAEMIRDGLLREDRQRAERMNIELTEDLRRAQTFVAPRPMPRPLMDDRMSFWSESQWFCLGTVFGITTLLLLIYGTGIFK